jgi:membrane protein implicated in regulation of membrane protease activity
MPIGPGRDPSVEKVFTDGITSKNPIAAHPISSALIAILIAGSILCTLIVPIYASVTPRVGDWPFFYFYLLACIPFVVIALCVTVLLQRRLRGADETAEAGE